MFKPRLKRRFTLCAPLAAIALLAVPALADAGSSGRCAGSGTPCFIARDVGHHTEFQFDSGLNSGDPFTLEIPCLTADEGTVTETGDESGRGNFVPDPNVVWAHFHGTFVATGRVEFPSGMYVLLSTTSRGGVQVADNRTTVTVSEESSYRGTVYDADGNATGQVVKGHRIKHYTFIDSGDAGVPFDSDPTDTFLADVDRTRWTCS